MSPIVPMPAFHDPNLPEAAGGSVNFGVAGDFPGLDEHPVEHSPDYGQGLARDEDRDNWDKPKWASLAAKYGLAVGGTKQEIIDRVTEHESGASSEEV